MNRSRIVLAGATGHLGGRIARELVNRGAAVIALVRRGSAAAQVEKLRQAGVAVSEVDYGRATELQGLCAGATCVVSALSGLEDVMVGVQGALLDAAVAAGCPRFIPSDFAIDFAKLPAGKNRNFDLRRKFKARLDAAPIAATSVLNGAFADMLTGQAPFVLPKIRRVLAWGDLKVKLDFTTMDDTAAFTASAALDRQTPRTLRIAGDQVTAPEIAAIASELSGKRYGVLRPGGVGMLDVMITVARALDRSHGEVFPPWQGMQYMRDMYGGEAKLEPLDNGRYPELRWTSVREVMAGDPRLRMAAGLPIMG
jgi:uncharacterized protein YbjT (DUF2867 family)